MKEHITWNDKEGVVTYESQPRPQRSAGTSCSLCAPDA